MNKLRFLIYFLFIGFIIGYLTLKEKNYSGYPAFTSSGYINAIVEIPAGTNHKIEYKPYYNKFENDLNPDGTDRIIEFLPYPGNYGFIPSTRLDHTVGGDNDPLDVLIISETEAVKTVIEVIPVAIIYLQDSGQVDHKIIAIPAKQEKRIIHSTNYQDFIDDHPAIHRIIELWFTSYKNQDQMKFLGWGDEKKAMQEISIWAEKE